LNNSFLKSVKDHSVSGETFSLLHDTELDMLSTFPIPKDLDRYYESEDYISHTDGARSLFETLYHIVKRYSIKSKVRLVTKFGKKGSLLDIGAGTGDFLITAKSRGWHIQGAEPNEKAAANAKSKGLILQADTATIADHSFDVITMWHVLEHVVSPAAQIREIKRLLKPNGLAVVAVPNFKSYDAGHYKQFWAAYDVPRHISHFSEKSIRALFLAEGFELIGVKPLWFDAFYVSILSEKYKSCRFPLVFGFWHGLLSNIKALGSGEFSSKIYLLRATK
jgi:2-polyprenyl-3-methyl-5-hydroxy-6-metoxy-1,4-benzoquinol methylase